MKVRVVHHNLDSDPVELLQQYSSISIAFEVREVYDINKNLQTFEFSRRTVETFIKDYDIIEPPMECAEKWNIQNWHMVQIYDDEKLLGGALIAWRTQDLNMLEERDDLAVLWDIRVDPNYRGKGLGTMLFNEVETWCKAHSCIELVVETQNINIRACKFYEKMGIILDSINRKAYPDLDEIQLIYRKSLITNMQASNHP